MADLRRVQRLIDQHAAARLLLSKRVQGAMRRLFRPPSRDSWYSPEWTEATAVRAAQVSRQAQQVAGMAAAKYMDLVLAEFDGIPESALGSDVRSDGASSIELPDDIRDFPADEVWERPGGTFRWNDARGVEGDGAEDRAVLRAELMADMELQLAERSAMQQVMLTTNERAGTAVITGWRRVVHPELSTGGVCGLCLVAADRVYSVEDLLAVHERCKCTVVPIADGEDPGLVLNREDISAIYKSAGGTSAQALAKIRFKIVEHGELGPVLRQEGQASRTAADAAADADESRVDITPWAEAASVETRQRKRTRVSRPRAS